MQGVRGAGAVDLPKKGAVYSSNSSSIDIDIRALRGASYATSSILGGESVVHLLTAYLMTWG